MPLRPKKSLGQHFLIDPGIVRKIAEAADIHRSDEILEIGPGKGILTRRLIESAKKVYAVEIDPRLVLFLKKEFESCPQLEILEGDILEISWDFLPASIKVAANIPYQISSPLLTKLIQERRRIFSMTLMLQKEVAQRITAKPGTKTYGPLSIFVQFYCRADIAFYIHPRSFFPPPKVESAVVKITPEPAPRFRTRDEAFFFKVVKAGFAHRRKSIRNSLNDQGFPPVQTEPVFTHLKLDPGRRAETFKIEEFVRLADGLYQSRSSA